MNALETAFVAFLIDDGDAFGIRKEDANQRHVTLDVGAEIMEGVGMATLNDGIGLRRERAHFAVASERVRMRQVPANGTRSQSGRCASWSGPPTGIFSVERAAGVAPPLRSATRPGYRRPAMRSEPGRRAWQ